MVVSISLPIRLRRRLKEVAGNKVVISPPWEVVSIHSSFKGFELSSGFCWASLGRASFELKCN